LDICPRTYLFGEEEGELRGTDNKYLFRAKWRLLSLFSASNIFRNARRFQKHICGFSKMLGTRLLSSKGKKYMSFAG